MSASAALNDSQRALDNLLRNVREFTQNTPCRCKDGTLCWSCLLALRLREYDATLPPLANALSGLGEPIPC